jgi:hypothetical protein
MVDFIQQVLDNLVEALPQTEIRVLLSYFTCSPKGANPRNVIVTVPRLVLYRHPAYKKAIDALYSADERMYGTCPSEGARKILTAIQGTRRPSVYLIITDGRVQEKDIPRYRSAMRGIVRATQLRMDQETVFGVTIGRSVVPQALAKNLGSTAIYPIYDFPGLVQAAPFVASMVRVSARVDTEIEYESLSASPTPLLTWSPTPAPTQRPSHSPTSVPTQRPSDSPTSAPTQRPSHSPTPVPTAAPTLPLVSTSLLAETSETPPSVNLNYLWILVPLAGMGVLLVAWMKRPRITPQHVDVLQAVGF